MYVRSSSIGVTYVLLDSRRCRDRVCKNEKFSLTEKKISSNQLSNSTIPGQPKKCYPGGKFPGINPKNLLAAFAARNFFRHYLHPEVQFANFFNRHQLADAVL